MNLSAPTKLVLLISLALVILALILYIAPTLIAALTPHLFWIAIAGYVLLLLGVLLPNL